MSVRFAHTDLKVPNFDEYRNSLSSDPKKATRESADERIGFSYLTTFGTGVIAAYTAKALVHDIVANVAPSADVLALAKIEVKLSEIPEGKNVVVKWRSKPLFIKHRTQAEIDLERKVDISTLRDPQTDESRVQKAEWLVLLGVCTHLGKNYELYITSPKCSLKYFICKVVYHYQARVNIKDISVHVMVHIMTVLVVLEKDQLH